MSAPAWINRNKQTPSDVVSIIKTAKVMVVGFSMRSNKNSILRLEVFSMLPQEIKKEILEYIDNSS